jgi:predicted ester cyclase
VENSDRVAWQRTLRAQQQGAFKGFPPSGRTIVWRDVITSRFRAGLIAEEWIISDLAEQLLLSRKKLPTA